jgi:hypothetical protein
MGCSPQIIPQIIKFQSPPDLRTCKDEPIISDDPDDVDFALYVLHLRYAGQDCRLKLQKRNELEDSQ